MSFYKSGFRRVLNSVSTARAKVAENTSADATLKTAVDLNTAKTGITNAQATNITSNTAYRIKVFEMVGTNAQWNALSGITSASGFSLSGSTAPDLRTDTILSVRLETYNPLTEAKTPTAISNMSWRFNPAGSFGDTTTDNVMFDIPFYGGNMANSAGVHISQASRYKSFSKSSNTECNIPISGDAVRLAVQISTGLATEEIPNKIRLVVVYVANAGSGYTYE